MRLFITILIGVGALIAPSLARADNYIKRCYDVHHSISAQSNVYSEIAISTVNSATLGTIKIYDATGKLLKTYTTTYPGSIKTSLSIYSIQSFTTIEALGNIDAGPLTIVIGFFASTAQPYPIVTFIEHYQKSDGSVVGEIRADCL